MKFKKLAPYIFIKNGKAVRDFSDYTLFEDGDVPRLAQYYSNNGADELVIFDLSDDDASHEQSLLLIKEVSRLIDIPMAGGGNIKRMEDVKKLIYAGCRKVFLNFSKQGNVELLKEVSNRFGKEKLAVCAAELKEVTDHPELIETYADEVFYLSDTVDVSEVCEAVSVPVQPVIMNSNTEALITILQNEKVSGVCADAFSDTETNLMDIKRMAKEAGVEVNLFESSLKWEDFKLNSDGMIPVIVQDYKTSEVLMMAYMNREAFEMTIQSGRMTYYSRSRNELWVKGLTSGHFQYVKQLSIDCDNDTILAKVLQIGAACHTGNRSCFYRDLVKKEYDETNPLKVFEKVYATIEDRKVHPKEGSYTNYLFEKGLDKILKKVGEEATEIIIAAKNPEPEEMKYEIADFMYHVMVLMSERGLTWEDITKELADRE